MNVPEPLKSGQEPPRLVVGIEKNSRTLSSHRGLQYVRQSLHSTTPAQNGFDDGCHASNQTHGHSHSCASRAMQKSLHQEASTDFRESKQQAQRGVNRLEMPPSVVRTQAVAAPLCCLRLPGTRAAIRVEAYIPFTVRTRSPSTTLPSIEYQKQS